MLTKTMIVVATAFVLGTATAAMATDTDPRGGYRESGAGAFATQGINPIYHKDSASKCAKAYPKTYDPSTMTFAGRDGVRHPCP